MITKNFKSISELIKAFPDEKTCIDHLEKLRWNIHILSPFDTNSKVYKCKGNQYRCKNTGKYFNVKTATLFDNTKIKLQTWFIAIYLLTEHKKGISSLQLAKDLNVTQKTAWFMAQRIRNCFFIENSYELDNEVEIDETFVGGKNKNRHANKKSQTSQGRSHKDKTPVIGLVERAGKLIARTIKDTKGKTLIAYIKNTVNENAKVYTDEWIGYNTLQSFYDHSFIKHSEGQFVKDRVHTNTIENFWSLLKRGIIGIYHFISHKHLQRYVNEFVFRYNTRKVQVADRFRYFLLHCQFRLTYKELVYGR